MAAYCVKENKACLGWVYKHFNDCACNSRDEASFGLGVLSVVSWAVAEIPQILTNFHTKSAHGISIFFILNWLIGDIFNLVGCVLEPVTLPSQLYTAVLFITATITLMLQSLYYDYFYKWWKSRRLLSANSSNDEHVVAPPNNNSFTQTNSIPRSAGYGAFLAASINLPHEAKALMTTYVAIGGRKLLHEHEAEHHTIGQWLGWLMAVIYISGRIPQICLNIRRGSAEGMSPFMFIFAIVGNSLYAGSIVVRTMEWDKIKPNLPWLLDAVGCAMLDSFILLQYIYYRNFRTKASEGIEGSED